MSGKLFKPTEKDFHHAWQLKMNGFTDAEIARKLGVSSPTFSLHRLKFLKYFAQRNREQERIREAELRAMGVKRGPIKLEKYRIAAVKLAELGENVNKIATILGLPDTTLRAWMVEDETFGHEMLTAADRLDHHIIRTLYRRAEGFATREAMQNEIRDARGNLVQRNTTRRVSRVLPSVRAIELWLTNRRKWLSEVQGESANNGQDNRPIEYEIVDKLFSETDKQPTDGKTDF